MDGRQHAQGQAIDLEHAQGVHVVLVPLDDRPLRHGGVLDGHQLRQRPAGDDETADVLGQVPGKAQELPRQGDELLRPGRVGVQPGLADALGQVGFAAVVVQHLGQPVHAVQRQP